MEIRSRLADSYAPMVWFSDLIILKSFLLSSGCCMPRSEAMVKRCLGALFSEPALEALSFLDRTERERFLRTLISLPITGRAFSITLRVEGSRLGAEEASHMVAIHSSFRSILEFDGL